MKFDYVRSARYTLLVSLIVLLAGVASLAVQRLNLGIDFTSGVRLQVEFAEAPSVSAVRDAVAAKVTATPVVQALPDAPGQFSIRTPALDDAQREAVLAALSELGTYELLGSEEVQPGISRELTRNAAMALGLAIVAQVIYIALRFDFRFGVSAVVALAHDALITLGLVSLLRIEVGAAFIAAVLTIIGYSINNTIVVFDRVRENLKTSRRGEPLSQVVNRSIGGTLRRSVNTTITTVLPLAMIAVFGGSTLQGFAITLLIGMFAGAYSSIFLAGPLWCWWTVRARRRPAKTA